MPKEYRSLQARPSYKRERPQKWFNTALKAFAGTDPIAKGSETALPPQSWKPVTLRAPLLLAIAGFSMSSAATLLYLSWRSRHNGGLAFTHLDQDFPLSTVFAYSYLPTLLAVLFGMFWSWVDLDTKRLEPYFQMSKPEGASSSDSLLLSYPFEFIAFAPIRAFKRRHWAVFLSGTTTALIFWTVTPLLGAVFTENRVVRSATRSTTAVVDVSTGMMKTTSLNAGILSDAYAITWLGRDLPGFVTSNGAVTQFKLNSDDRSGDLEGTWTAISNFYTTELHCTPAKIDGDPKAGYIYDNNQGCRTDPIPPSRTNGYDAFYIGYFNDPNVDWSLAYLGCPPNASHTFLAIWAAVLDSRLTKVTALFCEPTYLVQMVNATVSAANKSVIEAVALGPPTALSQGLFNTSDFEYLLGAGMPAYASRVEVTESGVIDQWRRMTDMEIHWPVSNMVGFAVGASRRPSQDYLNATVLASSFQSAHQLLFGLAVNRIASTVGPDVRSGLVTSNVKAIVVVPVLAIVVVVVLGLVTLFVLALLLVSSTRRSQLRTDPSSLSNVIKIAKPCVSGNFQRSDIVDINHPSHRFKLDDQGISILQNKPPRKSTPLPKTNSWQSGSLPECLLPSRQDYQPIRPNEMRIPLGLIFLAVLCATTAILLAIFIMITRGNGLPLPSTNDAVNQLALNYIPVMFATLLEPFWILLNRMLCILQPFVELCQGRAKPSQSLDVKYNSLPPQLIFWRALRARHLLLAAVCLVGFSANILAVSLGALFEDRSVHDQHSAQFTTNMAPTINQTALLRMLFVDDPNPYREHFFVAQSNITDETALPAWTTPRFYFVPFDAITTVRKEGTLSYSALTQGIGLNVQCVQFNSSESGTKVYYNESADSLDALRTDSPISIAGEPTNRRGMMSCTSSGVGTSVWGNVNGTYAAEFVAMPTPLNQVPGKEEQEFCSRQLIVAFLRANITVADSPTQNMETQALSVDITKGLYMSCKPTVQIGSFDVTVDQEGHVQSYRQEGLLKDGSIQLAHERNTSSLYNAIQWAIWSGQYGSVSKDWHTDLVADSWLSYLVKRRVRSTAFLDSSRSPPPATMMGPVLEELYGRLFAILLGINTQIFLPVPAESMAPGRVLVRTTRVFMSRPMFVVTIVLLTLNIILAVAYYTKRPPKMLQEMPTTIASVLRMVQGSSVVTEDVFSGSREEWQIGYGKYIGTDGKPHIGIERRPFVVPWAGN
ncbi:MAG: hypothetical protein Q9209_005985 [Squamulea sp. 1 TL-2023]